jgi:hypothetical protein
VHRRNSNFVTGSDHNVQVFSSSRQVKSHRNFSAKLKVSPHQKNNEYSQLGAHKVVKSTKNQAHSKYRNTSGVKSYKTNVARPTSVNSTNKRESTHQPSKHYASNKKQAVKKGAVRGGNQHKPRNKVK